MWHSYIKLGEGFFGFIPNQSFSQIPENNLRWFGFAGIEEPKKNNDLYAKGVKKKRGGEKRNWQLIHDL
jgi:hypothetical protein